ncbi:MAG: hypothetical protein R2708_08750 [Vicinamibacterales bacterium]
MAGYPTTRAAATALALCLAAPAATAQQALNWSADDGQRIETLRTTGDHIEAANLVLWFPPSLPRGDADALARRLDPAVAGLWAQVGTHDWQAVPKGPITYYLSDDAFVAHATGRGAVFVPMARVKDGRAPFLHEAVHELLASTRLGPPAAGTPRPPLWLTEGLPDYVARGVAADLGLTEQGPFGTPSLAGVDAVCAERAATPDGAAMLPFVGGPGRPAALFTTDRARFAPTFYSCSFSFVKHLVGRSSLAAVVGLFGETPDVLAARLETIGGKPVAKVRADWLRAIGLAAQAPR